MTEVSSRADLRARGRWFMAAALAMSLALFPRMAHADPVITGLSINQGDLGSTLSIFGSGFTDTMGQSYVLLGDQQLPVLSWTEPVITVLLTPRDASALQRNVPLELVVVQQPGNKRSNAFEFTVTGPVEPTTPGDGTGTTTGSTTGTTEPAASDNRALNLALLLHRLSAQFYNQNADKTYLTGATATTPDDGTGGTTTGGTTGGATTGGTTDGATTGGTTDGATTGSTTGTTGSGTTTGTTGSTTGGTTTSGTAGPAQDTGTDTTSGSNLAALRSLIQEIRAHHNAHVATLEQTLGTNAQPVPTFQNLDAPTLEQFLTMAQTMEDLGASAHAGLIPLIQDSSHLAMIASVGIVEGRHAGAIRTYRRVVSTAEGGDPNTTLTEDGSAVQVARTPQQVIEAVQGFIVGGIPDTSLFVPDAETGTGTGNGGTTGGTGTTTGGTGSL